MRKLVVLAVLVSTMWFLAEDLGEQFRPSLIAEQMKGYSEPKLAQAIPVSHLPAREVNSRTPVAAAQDYLESHRAEWKLQPHHQFRPEEVKLPLGSRVTFSVWQDGLFVPGQQIELMVDRDFRVSEIAKEYASAARVDWKDAVRLSPQDVLGKHEGLAGESAASAMILYLVPGTLVPELAYVMPVKEKTSRRSGQVVFRAKDGEILGRTFSRSEF